MTEMRPCPFCGGKVELRDKLDKGYGDETSFIHCTKCHMWFEKFDYRAMSHESIIEEWNRRIEVKPCPFCGAKATLQPFYCGLSYNWGVVCTETFAHHMTFGGTQEEVIKEWNRRVKDD